MADMTMEQLRRNIADTINRVTYGGERIVLGRRGKPVAAIIPVEEYELLERLIERLEDEQDIAEAERILADPNEKSVPYEQVREELGLE